MTKTAAISLASIAAQIEKDDAARFEPTMPNGDPSGIILLVRSDQHPAVKAALNDLANSRRKLNQIVGAKADKARPGEVFITVEQDASFVSKAAAIRLTGWEGIEDEFNIENAVRLFDLVPSWASQVVSKAGEMTGFTKASPTAS